MKANELMLGDHVSHFDEEKNCVVTELRGRKIAVSYTDDNGNTKYSELLPEMAFEPIPLTAEILEKNGFGYVENDVNPYENEVLSHFYLGEEGYCENMDVHIGTYNKGVFWFSSPKVSLNGIHYVHELQHAMRLCNIEKEIEL